MGISNGIADSPGNLGNPGEVERRRPILPVRAPLALALLGVAVIGILALFYVHEVASLTAANDELHTLQVEQSRLERQDADHRHAQQSQSQRRAHRQDGTLALHLAWIARIIWTISDTIRDTHAVLASSLSPKMQRSMRRAGRLMLSDECRSVWRDATRHNTVPLVPHG